MEGIVDFEQQNPLESVESRNPGISCFPLVYSTKLVDSVHHHTSSFILETELNWVFLDRVRFGSARL